MPTLSHSNAELETHLKDKDFFDIAVYPEAIFVFSTITGNKVTGKMTIKEFTQTITVPLSITKKGNNLLMHAIFTIDRTKYNIKYNSSSYFQDLGNYAIKNEFDLDINLIFNTVQ
jgi:polyisoprenoid-binding protein YceI